MDVYVRALSSSAVHNHDDFYTDQTILNSFLNYTTQIVSRYVNSPAILGWYMFLVSRWRIYLTHYDFSGNLPMIPGAYNLLCYPFLLTLFRCNSTLPATGVCNTTTITQWHSQVAQHIQSIDPNHLVTSG